jgi:hypothetical protein
MGRTLEDAMSSSSRDRIDTSVDESLGDADRGDLEIFELL